MDLAAACTERILRAPPQQRRLCQGVGGERQIAADQDQEHLPGQLASPA
jgi:hypothetical protein